MSALFQPFRALGYITENTPFAIQRLGKESFVTVSVGKAWQIYKCAKLTLALAGPELPGSISALAVNKDLTFAAVGNSIYECRRVNRSGQYTGHTGNILQLLVLGELLLSLGDDAKLTVWRIGDYDEPEHVLEMGGSFQPTCFAHPDTYLNKIVVGSKAGQLQLWNFVTGKLLYAFSIAESAVRCIAPSPALDVVAIGLSDGRAILHNLKFDERVATFENASGVGAKAALLLDKNKSKSGSGGACTAISFRTGAGVPLMVAGGGAGAITVWNLEERRIHTIIREAHFAPLLSLHFFPGEPRLMSAAADNSIKQWLFDSADETGRLLRFRSGHSAPPTIVRHYGDTNRLLSAGQDRAFRMFSMIQDQQSRELSQGHIEQRSKKLRVEQAELKLPRVIAMDACQVRERDWANVITAHANDPAAYTWRLQHFSLGDHILRPATKSQRGGDTLPEAPVTAVAISRCGNFGVVGTGSGRVDRYNMQSGIHRGMYARSVEGRHANAHGGSVTGLVPDSCNSLLISAGYDGWLRVWDFRTQRLVREIQVGSRPVRLAAHPGTALVAAASDDLVLRMFDVETGRQVRTFAGHRDRITDVAISGDGKWLLSSSMDGTLRVWDIPTARTLQVVVLGASVTSFSLAPGQELLATTHVNKRGIFLWANQYIFKGAADIVPSDTPVHASLPRIAAADDSSLAVDGDVSESEDEEDGEAEKPAPAEASGSDQEQGSSKDPLSGGQYHDRHSSGAPKPLVPCMVTLSMLPRSQWQNLAHLDAIKERSRPIEPPKKPEAAPFFLPTVASLSRNPTFDTKAEAPAGGAALDGALPGWGSGGEDEDADASAEENGSKRKRKKGEERRKAKQSRVLRNMSAAAPPSEFLQKLRSGAESGDYSEFASLLRSLTPIAVDQQLQAMRVVDLETAGAEDVHDLKRLLQFAEVETNAGRSFEYVQALLRPFLSIHGEAVCEDESLRSQAIALQETLGKSWGRLQAKLRNVRCLVNFLGDLPS